MLSDLADTQNMEICCFASRVKQMLELQLIEVMTGVGNIERQVFQVHCISLSDASPHYYSFPFRTAQTKPGENQFSLLLLRFSVRTMAYVTPLKKNSGVFCITKCSM